MLLTATDQSIELVTSAAGSIDYTVSYVDRTTTATTGGSNQGNITTATDTTAVAAPAASTQRSVWHLSVVNVHATIANTIKVQKDVNGTEYARHEVTLQPGESFEISQGELRVYDERGYLRLSIASTAIIGSVQGSPLFATANVTSVRTITSGSAFALWVGKAQRPLHTCSLRYRVTTAAASITWAEVAVAVGLPVLGANPTLTVVGYTDVSATDFLSTGIKSTTVNVSSGPGIRAGDGLWVVFGNSATTAAILRAQSVADDLACGLSASVASRPSTIVGTPTEFAADSATDLPFWSTVGV